MASLDTSYKPGQTWIYTPIDKPMVIEDTFAFKGKTYVVYSESDGATPHWFEERVFQYYIGDGSFKLDESNGARSGC